MSPTTTRTTSLLVAGAVVAALIGVVHLVEAPEYLEAAAYLGVLFVIGGLGPLAAAVAMVVPRFAGLRRLAITLTALAGVVMIVMGVVSRTVGLPGLDDAEWEPLLVVSLVLELVFVLMTPALLRSGRSRR